MIVVEPSAIAVTNPTEETVATAVSDELHVTVPPDTMLPPASFTVATSVAVSPIDAKFNALEDNSTVAAIRTTETENSLVADCPSPLVT